MAPPRDSEGHCTLAPPDAGQEEQPTRQNKTPNTSLRIQTHCLNTHLYPQKDAFTEQSSPILASLPLPPSLPLSKKASPPATSSSSRLRWSVSSKFRHWSQVRASAHTPQPQPNAQPPRLLATTEFYQDQQVKAVAAAATAEPAPNEVINRHYRPYRPPSDTCLQHHTKSTRPKNSKTKKSQHHPKRVAGQQDQTRVSGQFFQRLYHALGRIFTRRPHRRSRHPTTGAPTVADAQHHHHTPATTTITTTTPAATAATAQKSNPQPLVSPTLKQPAAEPTSQPHSSQPPTAPAKALVSSPVSVVSTADHLFDHRHSFHSNLSYLEVASLSTSLLNDHPSPTDDSAPCSAPSSSQKKPHHLDQAFIDKSSPPPLPSPPPSSTKTSSNPITSKMMKIIDKIKNHHHGDAPAPQQPPAAPVEKPARPTGPRMHPELLEMYDISEKVLGVGTFATVKQIRCKQTGKKFALKIILRKTLQGKGTMLETEISVLSKVRHPNCVSLLEMFETEDAVYLVTDLAEGGELFEQLLQKGYYTEGDAARLVRDVLLGVEYLHALDIVHRDLKPENLLFKDKSENATLMITDFGLSKVLTGDNHVLMTACGTPGYVAPEVLQQTGHGKPVDMWSIGVIAYTLLVGFMPFYGEDQGALFESIIAGEYEYEEEYWEHISPLAKAFIDSLLVTDPEKRPTAARALDHPWFRAVLEQDMVTPVSPADSVNLLPGIRKNFNARKMFKKAVRAVGILRKIHGAGSSSSFESAGASFSSTGSGRASGEFSDDGATAATSATVGGSGSRPQSLNGALSFHDVVQAVSLAHKGLSGVSEHEEEDVSDTMNKLSVKDAQ